LQWYKVIYNSKYDNDGNIFESITSTAILSSYASPHSHSTKAHQNYYYYCQYGLELPIGPEFDTNANIPLCLSTFNISFYRIDLGL
jgi:hypothetical protein